MRGEITNLPQTRHFWWHDKLFKLFQHLNMKMCYE